MKAEFFQNKENTYFLNKDGKIQYCHPLLYSLLNNNKESIKKNNYYIKKLIFLKKYDIINHNTNVENDFINKNDIQYAFNNSPGIVFETTSDCNLNCTYCGYGKLYNNNRIIKYASLNKAKKFLDYFIKIRIENNIRKKLFITFYGGEPLLNFNFIHNIIKYIKIKYKSFDFIYSITTNGILLKKYFNFFYENNFIIYISLDGNVKNNSYRITKNNKSSYLTVYKNIKWVQNRFAEYFTKNIYILSVIHNFNKDIYDLQTFMNFEFNKYSTANLLSSNNINPQHINEFNKIYYSPKYNKKKMKNLFMMNYSEYIRHVDITKEQRERFFKTKIVLNNNKIINYLTGTCIPFSRKIFISAEGKIYPCERINKRYVHGYINLKSINIDFNLIKNNLNELILNQKFNCINCDSKYFCTNCIYHLDKANCIDNKKSLESIIEKHLELFSNE